MTNTKLTDEQLQEIYGEAVSCEVAEKNGAYMASFDLLCKMDDVGGTAYTVRKLIDMLRAERAELQERRKASKEPVRYLNKFSGVCGTLEQQPNASDDVAVYMPLYAAPPASEREQVRREHAEWSDKTFGDIGPVGPLKHLSKEALEAAADPFDPLEWADMQFLLWDAQRRMGISDEFITRAMIEKLAINKARQWPEPKDGEPRLHIKEQPASVVPPAIEPDYEVIKSILPTANPDEYACTIAADMWNACRAAMLRGNHRDLSQPIGQQVAEYEKIMLQGSQPVSNRDELSKKS